MHRARDSIPPALFILLFPIYYYYTYIILNILLCRNGLFNANSLYISCPLKRSKKFIPFGYMAIQYDERCY